MLLYISGKGWYQAWGEAAWELHLGDVANIPAGVKIGMMHQRIHGSGALH